MEKSEHLYTGIGNELMKKNKAVVLSQMFGMPTLKAGGKAFAGLAGDEMVFKLTGDVHARAMKLKGAHLFDPSGMNRPMKEWVQVPASSHKEWKELAEAALSYVSAELTSKLKPKKAAKKK